MISLTGVDHGFGRTSMENGKWGMQKGVTRAPHAVSARLKRRVDPPKYLFTPTGLCSSAQGCTRSVLPWVTLPTERPRSRTTCLSEQALTRPKPMDHRFGCVKSGIWVIRLFILNQACQTPLVLVSRPLSPKRSWLGFGLVNACAERHVVLDRKTFRRQRDPG